MASSISPHTSDGNQAQMAKDNGGAGGSKEGLPGPSKELLLAGQPGGPDVRFP
jgi:hypothetical protein